MKTCPLCNTGYPSHKTNCDKDGALLIESRELEPGTVIRDKYRIVRLLGHGGMGTVYLAEHILLGQQRALKFISSELAQDARFLKRFRNEAQASIKLRHPNVVEVVDLDQAEDGSPYIAMEFVEGEDLRHALSQAAQNPDSGPTSRQGTTGEPASAGRVPQQRQNEGRALAPEGAFPVERALAIARGIAQGLGAAHAKGIVHRDVKPENILLAGGNGAPETPKLLDFGIAAIQESATAVSRTRGLMLTPPYAAPEQWQGMPSEQLDGRADLYALGGVLYEMLTGQTVFRSLNTEGWMHRHLHEEPQPPSRLRHELANWPGLDALVLRLLAKDREQRPENAAELLGSLDSIRYRPPDAHQETEIEGEAYRASHERGTNTSKTTGHRGIWPGLLAAGFILATIGVWFASRRPTQPADSMTGMPPAAQQQADTSGGNIPMPKGLTPEPPVRVPKGLTLDDPAGEEKNAEALYRQKHYSDAKILFGKSCNEGQLKACSYLGYFYAQGLGGARDTQKARDVYQKACNQGNLSSCASLGSIYQDAGNSDEAGKYFQKACNGGVQEACDLLRGVQ
ncbi:MAG: serine/threonine-protein kinase [Terracidiphilus sp.]